MKNIEIKVVVTYFFQQLNQSKFNLTCEMSPNRSVENTLRNINTTGLVIFRLKERVLLCPNCI